MERLRSLKDKILRWIKKIRRYPNELRVTGSDSGTFDNDNMIISSPQSTLEYFRFEYIVSMCFSAIIVLATIAFELTDKEATTSKSYAVLKYWLRIGVVLQILSILPKCQILWRLFQVPVGNETLIVRRLMLLIRSNVFFWNEKAAFIIYNYYFFGMSRLASTHRCGSMNNNLYLLVHFIICCFLFRFANLFIRYIIEYYLLTRTISYDSIIAKEATPEEIASIPEKKYNEDKTLKENSQWCAICLEYFQNSEIVKVLPCAKQHIFHKFCIETWLKKQNVCPYCHQSLRIPGNGTNARENGKIAS